MIVKKFDDFSSLDNNSKTRLIEFREFNDFLEKNPKISINDVQNSYLKVLSANAEIDTSFQELDFHIKKLMDNTNLAINSVLTFLDEKYVNKTKVVSDFFSKKWITLDDELIDWFLEWYFDYISLEYFKVSIEISNEWIVWENNVDIILNLISKQFEKQVWDEVEVSFYLNSN